MPDDLARFTVEELQALGEAMKAKDDAAKAGRGGKPHGRR